ncbi:hypothetical protein SAMN05216360_12050 [Methylobacterium phyllostachyos]|uniref:Nickel/cobalt transporter regulator n=1 Tax=Methylobacterium phyllostachyos TaxID=582672 RepID=A0A1H0IVQ9_9HYPH|nr:hypothetical protein [Methylobacterium phyllostachyos]SDO35369.1 hypothetical protein SAMN05216360_12050 [Methylobacterium phyllostachyos]
MPHGARTSLAALILLLGVGSATAEPAAGTTWTDPPVHKPAAEAPAPKAVAPASTPAAVAEAARPAPARKAAARKTGARPVRSAVRRTAPRRVAAAAHRPRIAAASPRAIVGPRVVALAPPPEGYARYRSYGYGPGYADGRLDRLSSAEAAGYVVVRRRTVVFPDGRTLRVYRPDDGEPF